MEEWNKINLFINGIKIEGIVSFEYKPDKMQEFKIIVFDTPELLIEVNEKCWCAVFYVFKSEYIEPNNQLWIGLN
jgi:hypothetical protein